MGVPLVIIHFRLGFQTIKPSIFWETPSHELMPTSSAPLLLRPAGLRRCLPSLRSPLGNHFGDARKRVASEIPMKIVVDFMKHRNVQNFHDFLTIGYDWDMSGDIFLRSNRPMLKKRAGPVQFFGDMDISLM